MSSSFLHSHILVLHALVRLISADCNLPVHPIEFAIID
jgi:hypothetical protein